MSGCSGDEEPASAPPPAPSAAAPQGSGDAVDPSGTSPAYEGPAAAGAKWPDGLTAKLTAVERVPNAWGADVPKSLAIVRLTVEVRNGTQDVLPFESGTRQTTVYYGPNRVEAEQDAGHSYPDPDEAKRKELQSDDPTRIPAGGSARFVESWVVPSSELGDLTVAIDLPATDGIRETFTLTGAQTLLKTVR